MFGDTSELVPTHSNEESESASNKKNNSDYKLAHHAHIKPIMTGDVIDIILHAAGS